DNWYHRSRVMDWPAFAASATRTVKATGADDDITIQKAIDSLPASGGKIVLLPGTYMLGSAIRPKNNTEMEIRGTLKVADAVRSELTADVASGATTLAVADARRFRVGQWVTVCEDDPRLDHKGGRRYGESVTIKSIAGNTLTVSARLGVLWAKSKWQVAGYTVGRKAFVTTSHSAIMVEGVQRVYIHGGTDKRGEIDGNRARQSATAPLATDETVEDLRANCGIGIVHSSWVKVENLLLRDANLHNIAFYKSDHCEAAGLESAGCNDKNICVLTVETLRLINNYCHDSVLEDGICCHAPGGPYILIANNRATGHKRMGIHVGYSSPHSLIARNVAWSNRSDFLININNPRVPPAPAGKKTRRHDTLVFNADRRHRWNATGEVLPWPAAADLAKEGVLFIENVAGKK
ncbi:MAG: hypothetical protein FJ388_21610, partial [Verrucomicrobia bacterium]|nr:hypothetical protein [Verrucomicrobiota bacterium]